MKRRSNATVYLIDDDAGVRDALAWLLRSRRLISEPFDSAESFAAFIDQPGFEIREPACALLDVRMGALSGLALFERLIEQGMLRTLPVIFLTGHADVPTAVDAVKRGAFDFFEKPFSDNTLVDRVEAALDQSSAALAARDHEREVRMRWDSLTEREREILQRIVAGLANKQIADELSISVRTVEVHRARVFDKMRVKSAVELANLLRAPDKG